MKKELIPWRIVLSDGVLDAENLLIDKPSQSGFATKGYTTIKRGGYVLLDFGREIRGGISICTRSVDSPKKCARCRIVFGESVMEALSEIGEKNATNDHAIRDTEILVPCMGNAVFGNTGFRFFKLEVIDADVSVKAIKAVTDMLDIDEIGSFECSDERLNEIWKTGAYTVYLNMGEYIWDGVKRDRLVWLGDMHPECATVYAVYGNHPCIKRSLDLIKSETPADEWINTLPSYSLWWIINQYEWYIHGGDLGYLTEHKDYITAIIKRIYNVISNPIPDNFNYFVDWSSNSDVATKRVGFFAVLYKCFDVTKKIAELIGCLELFAIADDGQKKILSLDLTVPNHKQMAGIAAYSGMKSAEEMSEKILKVNPLSGLSTFFGYYVLLALGESGNTDLALDVIRGYWGAMLDLGATTFFEDFDIEWCRNAGRIDEVIPEGKVDPHGDYGKYCYLGFRHSLCHGWASGPTAFLTEYVLGIRIAEAGCKKITVEPNLCGLEWAKGSFPTPYGKVTVEHIKHGDRIETKISAPKEVEVIKIGK